MTDHDPSVQEHGQKGRYVITTPGQLEEVSRPFETLAAAQRALESARQIYPDAYITTIDRVPFKQ
jgi:hypothetical protein